MDKNTLDLVKRLSYALLEYHLGLNEILRPFPATMARDDDLIKDAEDFLRPHLDTGLTVDFIHKKGVVDEN